MLKIRNLSRATWHRLWVLFTVLLVLLIIAYLVYDGQLNFEKMSQLYQQPFITFWLILMYIFGVPFITTLRWWFFIISVRPKFSFLKLLKIGFQSQFLSLVIPGSGGLDIIKTFLLFRQERYIKKTPLAVTVIMDRIIGILALLVLAVGVSVFYPNLPQSENLHSFILSIDILLFSFAAVLFLLLGPFKWPTNIAITLAKKLPSNLPEKIIRAIIVHRDRKLLLLITFGVSFITQLFIVWMFYLIFGELEDKPVGFALCLILVPTGMLITILPIGPAGIGAGYIGFAYLFNLAGINQGANAYNYFVLIQLLCSLLMGFFLLGPTKFKKVSTEEIRLFKVVN